ncbi:hypothetical protein PG997_014672 [Apiospora hydei]|uniref:2EXR domain-containing protein n=1 Tax=Apiospora hydei TaxID=1337664 RepID=A0ABR1UUH6_9PEZI
MSDERFSLFSKFPPEIRVMIWEAALHEEYRDRVLILDEATHRIVASRELQQPFRAVFHASRESRYVANSMFPVRLPMYRFHGFPSFEWYQRSVRGNAAPFKETLETPASGEIPVSLALDNFMVGFSWRWLHVQSIGQGFVGGFVSGNLSPQQTRLIWNLIQVVIDDRSSEAARRDPESYLDLSAKALSVFGGVQKFRCLYPISTNGPRIRSIVWGMGDQISYRVDAALNWHFTANDGTPSYNGRALLLHGQHPWKMLTCADFQARLHRTQTSQE